MNKGQTSKSPVVQSHCQMMGVCSVKQWDGFYPAPLWGIQSCIMPGLRNQESLVATRSLLFLRKNHVLMCILFVY